ncbi:MAG: hypothetical protein WAM14_17180 [Candidatus Nitrosopolaris sp.]
MNYTRPPLAIGLDPIRNAFLQSRERGIYLRYITEITKENLSYCKELRRVRHLDAIKGNFMVSGSPYVYLTFADPNDYKPGAEKPQNPFDPNMMAFTSPEDLMKNLPKAMGNISRAVGGGGTLTNSPTLKISRREYEDMAIKVGDKITIEIKKSDSSGIYR